jgi:hypothetical protein
MSVVFVMQFIKDNFTKKPMVEKSISGLKDTVEDLTNDYGKDEAESLLYLTSFSIGIFKTLYYVLSSIYTNNIFVSIIAILLFGYLWKQIFAVVLMDESKSCSYSTRLFFSWLNFGYTITVIGFIFLTWN